MTWLLPAAVLLAVVDAVVTHSRLKLNPNLELNPLVRLLEGHLGPVGACLIGVVLPQSLLALLASARPTALAMFVGAQAYRTLSQLLAYPVVKHLSSSEVLRTPPSTRATRQL